MIRQNRFNSNLKTTFNGDEYTYNGRKVLKLNTDKKWKEINFAEVKSGDTIKLQDPDGSLVYHEDGRNTFVAKSNTKLDELGLLCFEI
jgi:hypothetical protein